MLRYPTLDLTTSRCIVSNRYSRNCSTPNLKIEFRSKLTYKVQYTTFFVLFLGLPVLCLRGQMGSQGAGVANGQNSAP
jgi:hypothetical protein